MVEESLKFADEDRIAKERVDAQYSFENYIYSMRNTIEDPEKLGSKISSSDKQKIKEGITEAQSWLESNRSANKEEFEKQHKQLER